jgi:hypothetical protein
MGNAGRGVATISWPGMTTALTFHAPGMLNPPELEPVVAVAEGSKESGASARAMEGRFRPGYSSHPVGDVALFGGKPESSLY